MKNLETSEDTLEKIEKQLLSVKLLSLLSASSMVQERQFQNPKALLEFIKSLFPKVTTQSVNDDDDKNTEIVFMALMLVKLIISDKKVDVNWKPYEEFVVFLQQQLGSKNIPKNIELLIMEIMYLVNNKKEFQNTRYHDLSEDNKNSQELNKAIMDLTDPLLPVKAHGIIAITRLIDSRHPETLEMCDFLLAAFQVNRNLFYIIFEQFFLRLKKYELNQFNMVFYYRVILLTMIHFYIWQPLMEYVLCLILYQKKL